MIRKPAFASRKSASNFGRIAVVLTVASVFLNGCAPLSPNAKYLFAPEVRTCPPKRSPYGGKPTIDCSCWARVKEPIPRAESSPGKISSVTAGKISTVTVGQATDYARQIEEEYVGAKSEYGSISSAVGIVLIPAGTSALALGGLGESATAVSSLGFGSAGLLGAGYWLSNTKREKVYMTGADALECLIGTMQPFDVEQMDFDGLKEKLGDWANAHPKRRKPPEPPPPTTGLAYANFEVESHAAYLEEELAILKADPKIATDACLKPALCYAERALKAAKTGTQAASKAYDAEQKYQQFSELFAGNAMVSVANTINNKVNKVMTDTEPNLQALANELSSAIPQSVQKLSGISSASSAATAATAAT